MSGSLTVTWEDPLETFASAAALTGLEYLRAIGEGRLPKAPIAELMGFDGLEADESPLHASAGRRLHDARGEGELRARDHARHRPHRL